MPRKLTQQEFIEKAVKVYNTAYTYERCTYVSHLDKVTITCPVHGDFQQGAGVYLRGRSCTGCTRDSRPNYGSHARSKSRAATSFKPRSEKIHNNKYDYNKVYYKGARVKVEIICPKHGSFWQIPNDHVRGIGCSKCSNNYSKAH